MTETYYWNVTKGTRPNVVSVNVYRRRFERRLGKQIEKDFELVESMTHSTDLGHDIQNTLNHLLGLVRVQAAAVAQAKELIEDHREIREV